MTRLRVLVPRCNRSHLTDREIRIGYLWMPIYWFVVTGVILLFGPIPWWLWYAVIATGLTCGVLMGVWLNSRAGPRKFRERIWKESQ